jgi:hypothetical protein
MRGVGGTLGMPNFKILSMPFWKKLETFASIQNSRISSSQAYYFIIVKNRLSNSFNLSECKSLYGVVLGGLQGCVHFQAGTLTHPRADSKNKVLTPQATDTAGVFKVRHTQ